MDSNKDRERGAMEATGESLGGMAGQMAGRAADAAIDAASEIATAAFETLGGWWAGTDARQAASSFSDNDAACRRHFETTSPTSEETKVDYYTTRPAYGFGYVARHNPDYQGKEFDQIERELERAWEESARDRHGEWPEVQDRVRFGYDGA